MKHWAAVVAGALLVGTFALARRGPDREEIPRRAPTPPVTAVEEPVQPTASRIASGDDFWSDLERLLRTKPHGDRGETRADVVNLTARHLGWEESRASGLASMTDGVVRALESAWAARDAEVLALTDLQDTEEREQHALAAQLRYEEAKRQTLTGLQAMFDPGREPERRLLEMLEEWIDAVR